MNKRQMPEGSDLFKQLYEWAMSGYQGAVQREKFQEFMCDNSSHTTIQLYPVLIDSESPKVTAIFNDGSVEYVFDEQDEKRWQKKVEEFKTDNP